MIKQIGKFEFKDNLRGFAKFERRVPELIAVNSVNHFQAGFRKGSGGGGGQTDDSLGGWADRKSTKRRSGRSFGGILVDTESLLKDIKKRVVKFALIIVGTSDFTSDYADRHNRGLAGMPKREFIGDSKKLEKSNQDIIDKEMDKVMNV